MDITKLKSAGKDELVHRIFTTKVEFLKLGKSFLLIWPEWFMAQHDLK